MKYFKLIPNSVLESIKHHYSDEFTSWINLWACTATDETVDYCIHNSYEYAHKLNEFSKVIHIEDEIGNDLLMFDNKCNQESDYESLMFGDSFDFSGSILASSVLEDSIKKLSENVFGLVKPSLTIYKDDENVLRKFDNLLFKGSGSVVLEVTVGNHVLCLLLSQKVFDQLSIHKEFTGSGLTPLNVTDFDLGSKEVSIAAFLDKTSLKYGDILKLQPNDVIVLDHKCSSEVSVKVNNYKISNAQLGMFNGNKALLLK